MTFPDYFSGHAGLYASARPAYPSSLFAFVASIAPSRARAWDCATGNGQAALGLTREFARVEATDASAPQIAHALPSDRVGYSVQAAEQTNFAASSFDAVCVAQALHWFDFERFYAEVRRVLKPHGVFVAWGYDAFTVETDFDREFIASILEPLEPYWAPQNALLWNGYREVPFPFERLAVPDFSLQMRWSFPQLFAYVSTWSAVRKYLTGRGPNALAPAAAGLAEIWGYASVPRLVTMDLHLLAGRLPDSGSLPE